MLTFSRKSWHYRLFNKLYDFDVPSSLCTYFWLIALALLLVSVIAIVVTVLIISAVTPILYLTDTLLGWFPDGWNSPKNSGYGFMLVGYIEWGLFAGALAKVGWDKTAKWRWERRLNREANYVTPEPNVLVEFIKAKKKKVCPRIEFE